MQQNQLVALGLDAEREEEVTRKGLKGKIARVVRVDRTLVTLRTSSNLVRIVNSKSTPLIVGDWVVTDDDSTAVRLVRRTELARRTGQRGDERQATAANIDLVLVVRALDTAIRLNRLSSLLVIAYDSGATPLLVLTKADVIVDALTPAREIASGLGGVDTIAVSTVNGTGLDDLRQRISGKSVVLLGESGAGKSTLTNTLFGSDALATATVRRDGQGRHTTTHRELIVIPTGGVIIDTPGVREASSFGDREGVERTFADIVAIAAQCRFSNCPHLDTPGCAIDTALYEGRINQERFDSYLHEVSEREWLERRVDAKTTSEQKATSRSRTKRLQKDQW